MRIRQPWDLRAREKHSYHLVDMKRFCVVFKRRVATQSRGDMAALRPPAAWLGAGGLLQSHPCRRSPSGLRLGLMSMEKGTGYRD